MSKDRQCAGSDFNMWRYLAMSLSLVTLGSEGSILPFENNHLNATVGGYAVMNCHLDFPFGHEIPYQLEWEKDGETIFSWYSADTTPPKYADSFAGRVQQLRENRLGLGRGSINLTSVRETDNGLYHCRVLFPNRTPPTRNNGTYYYLEVEGGNLIATPPVNVTCLEGERAEFECLPKSMESMVGWYKDGEAINDLMDLAHRAVLYDNGSLAIEHTTMTDLGEYECHVRDPDGELQTASAFLDVQYKAKVTYSPKERYLPYGKPARLDCHFSANPPLTNLRWEKDGFLFDSYNVPGVYYSRNGSLLFNEVDDTHAGLYSCTPYNSLGTEGPSAAVRVHVLRPPKISPLPRPLYLARLGQPLTMACGADDNNAPPAITWTRKDGVPLPEGRYFLDGGNLTLDSVTEEDRGVYVCTAHNDAATTTAMAELMIENVPPRAPYNLTALASIDSIHVKWVPGYLGQNVEYTIWYRPRAQSEWHTMKILSLGVTEGTLLRLKPGAEYEVRVLAQDHIGDGLFSKPIFVRTAEAEIQGSESPIYATESGNDTDEPPNDIAARAIAEGVLVTWNAGPEARRCNVRWYRGPEARLHGSTHTTNNYVLVTDVEEGEQYLFMVWCGDGPGVSDEAATVSLQVPAYSRLRTVAAAAGGAALVLAVVAAVIYFARDRICALRDGLSDSKCRR